MAFFKRKNKVIDLTEHYHRQQEKAAEMQGESQESTQSEFNFLGNLASASSTPTETSPDYVDVAGSVDDRRKKLAKRLMEMTSKMEDLSNQIYHLQQRIEVLERKSGSGGFD